MFINVPKAFGRDVFSISPWAKIWSLCYVFVNTLLQQPNEGIEVWAVRCMWFYVYICMCAYLGELDSV